MPLPLDDGSAAGVSAAAAVPGASSACAVFSRLPGDKASLTFSAMLAGSRTGSRLGERARRAGDSGGGGTAACVMAGGGAGAAAVPEDELEGDGFEEGCWAATAAVAGGAMAPEPPPVARAARWTREEDEVLREKVLGDEWVERIGEGELVVAAVSMIAR
jgi:hypothetical protein